MSKRPSKSVLRAKSQKSTTHKSAAASEEHPILTMLKKLNKGKKSIISKKDYEQAAREINQAMENERVSPRFVDDGIRYK